MAIETKERIVQLCSSPHTGTVYALTDRGRLFEQVHDPRPASDHLAARNPYRLMWRELALPDFNVVA